MYSLSDYLLLFLLGYPSRPQVVKPTSLVELVQTNFHFSLLCKSNVRNAQIHWEKRNKMLSSNVYGVNSSNLTIFNMIPNDSGEYRCVVSNSTGIIESEYSNLTVRGMWSTFVYICINKIVLNKILKEMY